MRTRQYPAVEAAVGFAADGRGEGVAYARLRTPAGERLTRVGFRTTRYTDLGDREVSYAALTAIASALRERGIARVSFKLQDESLVRDMNERREIPPPLVVPYVSLGCALNRFEEFTLIAGEGDGDLTERAKAEAALHIAA